MRWLSNIWQNSHVGLDISDHTVRLVEVANWFSRITLNALGEEPIDSDGDAAGAIECLVRRLNIRQKEVWMALHRGVRFQTVTLKGDEQEHPDDLIRHHIQKSFSVGVDLENWLIAWSPVHQDESGVHCLAAYTRPEPVLKQIELVKRAGLEVAGISAGYLDLPLLLEKTGHSNDEPLIMESHHGVICFDQVNGVYQSGVQHADWEKSLHLSFTDPSKSQLASLSFSSKGPAVDAAFFPAAALAVRGCSARRFPIDLLPGSERLRARDRKEKRWVLRTALAGGLGFLILFLSLTLCKQSRLKTFSHLEARLEASHEKLFEVKRLKSEGKRLGATLRDLQSMLGERSRRALIIDELGGVIPEKVWLQELRLQDETSENGKRATSKLTLLGMAFEEKKVTALLAAMEKNQFFSEVMLMRMETLSGEDVLERSKIFKRRLYEFVVKAELAHE